MWFLREPEFASSLGQSVHCTWDRRPEPEDGHLDQISSYRPVMIIGVAKKKKEGRTRATYLWRLRVNPSAAVKEAVDAQGGAACEGFATVLAHVRLLSGVEDHVLLQVPLQAVALVTVGAGERTLPAVTHLQITGIISGNGAATRLAARREQP